MILLISFSCKAQQTLLPTVSHVDLNRYLGCWYEIAKLPNSFEKGLDCITATYSLNNNGTIKVVNRGRKVNQKTKWSQVKGKAWIPNNAFPGQLKVQFFWPFAGNYYILALDENYQYALIGDPSRNYLWILSKSKILDKEICAQLLVKAKELGFAVDKVEFVHQE